MKNDKHSLISKMLATKDELETAVHQYKSTYEKAKRRLQTQSTEDSENHKDSENH